MGVEGDKIKVIMVRNKMIISVILSNIHLKKMDQSN